MPKRAPDADNSIYRARTTDTETKRKKTEAIREGFQKGYRERRDSEAYSPRTTPKNMRDSYHNVSQGKYSPEDAETLSYSAGQWIGDVDKYVQIATEKGDVHFLENAAVVADNIGQAYRDARDNRADAETIQALGGLVSYAQGKIRVGMKSIAKKHGKASELEQLAKSPFLKTTVTSTAPMRSVAAVLLGVSIFTMAMLFSKSTGAVINSTSNSILGAVSLISAIVALFFCLKK